MSNKILFNILTCNRFYYFKNCIESILEFCDLDRIDILVCDNNTVEAGFDEYCNEIMNKHKNIKLQKFPDRVKNELYRAMNWAVSYAKKERYKIVNFIQDDYQWLSYDNNLIDGVHKMFAKHNEIVQINTNMAAKRKHKGIGKIQVVKVAKHNYAILLSKVPCDNGFTRVAVYDKIGKYPSAAISWSLEQKGKRYNNKMNGEIWFGRQCRKRSMRRAIKLFASSGMMFDCSYVRGDRRYGRYFPPIGKYYLKPLEDNQIEKIRRRASKGKFSFMEDMCIPDGWKPLTMGKHSPLDSFELIKDVR